MSVTYHALLSEDQNRSGMLYFGEAQMALLDIEADFWGVRRQTGAQVGRRTANDARTLRDCDAGTSQRGGQAM